MASAADSRPVRYDPLREVRLVKRLVQVLAYGTIAGFAFYQRLVLDMNWLQLWITFVAAMTTAIVAVEYAFTSFFRLRKQSAYPGMLAVELGPMRDLDQACQKAVETVASWLGAEAAVLTCLRRERQGLEAKGAVGLPPDWYDRVEQGALNLEPFREAIERRQVSVRPVTAGDAWASFVKGNCQAAYVPVVSTDGAVGVLSLAGTRRTADIRDTELLAAIGLLMGLSLDNIRLYRDEYRAILHLLCSALDQRDRVTEGHCRRVADLSLAVARQLSLDSDSLLEIERAAILHDIGKVVVPDAILSKAGPLTPEEWKVMRSHPEVGYQMVKDVPFLHQAAEIIYAHHERYDGSGYPRGLRGGEIPLGARIFAVVDAYDAITSDRPYRKARPHGQALDEVRAHVGSQFDPWVVEAFLRIDQKEPLGSSKPPSGGSQILKDHVQAE